MTHAASQNSPTDSLKNLQARVQLDPNDGAAWLAIAQALARNPPGPELRMAISKSIELLPDDCQAWLLAGLEMQQSRGTTAALRWLQNITQQWPGLAAPRLARAQLCAATEAEEANQAFLAVIKDFPGDSRAHLLYAEHLQNQGQLRAAGDQLEAALNIKPDLAENWTALAMIRLAEHRFEDVVRAASRALGIDKNSGAALLARAEAYRQAAQWKQALEDFRQVQNSMPANPFVLMGLGACLTGEGAFDEALQQLRKALQIKPDFAEARFNIALVLASQAKAEEASASLAPLLRQKELAPALRQSALMTQAALQEQQRLQPHLRQTGEGGNLEGLKNALLQAPEILLQADLRSEDILRAMAVASKKAALQLSVSDYGLEIQHSAFVEACVLSRAANNAGDMLGLWQDLRQHEANPLSLTAVQQSLRDTWDAVLDRKSLSNVHFEAGSGEAWLRYWHFRLFGSSAGHLPGLFKVAPNSIGLNPTTAPQHVIRAIRTLLDEIYPTLPLGLSRAAFLLASINRIHAFIDGNGRMARFFFNWELERAGLSTVLWTPGLRKALTRCLDQAQYRNNFETFQEVLQQAQSNTQTLCREFSEGLARI